VRALVLAAAGLVCLFGWPGPARGQKPTVVPASQVYRSGVADAALDRRLSGMLRESALGHLHPPPVVLVADTQVVRGDTIDGDVLVLDATLILEGTVTGDLVLVDAGAFVRAGSRVEGDLVNIGGGLYRSELSHVGGSIVDLPSAPYRVDREPGRFAIRAIERPDRLTPDGVAGFHAPTYDRVNGLTLVWGARYRLPRLRRVVPSVHGQIGWRTQRGEPTFGASLALNRARLAGEVGYDKGSATNDRWIADDLSNSLSYLWNGDDYRDYHQAERFWVGITRELGDAEKAFHGAVELRGQVEDATTIRGGEPWHLLGDSARSNPPVDDGRTTSLTATFDVQWHGRKTWFEGGVEYEAARDWLDGDYSFDRVAVTGDWAMQGLADHTLEVDFFVQQRLGGTPLPRQRWSYVGGSRTLQTVAFGRYMGDRVVFVETGYSVPAPRRVSLPFLGSPYIRLIHAVGMAWSQDDAPAFAQEIGVRLSFFILDVRYMVDPADLDHTDLDFLVNVPLLGGYPWQY
jgi:hypothetical protein